MNGTRGLELIGVGKSYGQAVAVDNINLSIDTGEFVCLLGPSGCGKTTTLRIIAGLVAPDIGEVNLGGQNLSRPGHVVRPEARNMSLLFQAYALWPHMTVRANVGYGLVVRKMPKAQANRRVDELLEIVQVGHLGQRYPGELSGGQQQRVALARALAVEPSLLLMDEPLSSLDAALREEMRLEIRRIQQETRTTTVYVTHDLTEAMVVADRIAVMKAGVIEQIGSPEDVYERPNGNFVATFVGNTNILDGILQEASVVRLPGGEILKVDASALSACGSPSTHVAVVMRAHDFRVVDSGPEASLNQFDVVVARRSYLGSTMEYEMHMLSDGSPIRVSLTADKRFPVGERLRLGIPAAQCRVIGPGMAQSLHKPKQNAYSRFSRP